MLSLRIEDDDECACALDLNREDPPRTRVSRDELGGGEQSLKGRRLRVSEEIIRLEKIRCGLLLEIHRRALAGPESERAAARLRLDVQSQARPTITLGTRGTLVSCGRPGGPGVPEDFADNDWDGWG